MASIYGLGLVNQGLPLGVSNGASYLGGAALDRLGGLDPLGLTSPMQSTASAMGLGSNDALLQMLMQVLMGLMSNSAGTGLMGSTGQSSLSDTINQAAGGTGGGGGGAGSIGGGGSGGGGGGGASSVSGGGSSVSGPVPDSGPVAPGTAALLKDAGKMVGLNENRDRAAIQKVTGESGINPSTTPWCAAFAINMMKDHGVLDTKGLSNPNYCPTVKSWAAGKHIWGESGKYHPKPGDAILFDWQGDGTPDHIGIVESVKGGKVYTIEGNSSDSVKRNSYGLGDSKIDGYVVSKDSTGKSAKATSKTASKADTTTEAGQSTPKAKTPPATKPQATKPHLVSA